MQFLLMFDINWYSYSIIICLISIIKHQKSFIYINILNHQLSEFELIVGDNLRTSWVKEMLSLNIKQFPQTLLLIIGPNIVRK